jgi:hypothetical protein
VRDASTADFLHRWKKRKLVVRDEQSLTGRQLVRSHLNTDSSRLPSSVSAEYFPACR